MSDPTFSDVRKLTFSTGALTLREMIDLRLWTSAQDPEALLRLLLSRSTADVTAGELLDMNGDWLAANIEAMVVALGDAVSGRALVHKHGVQ